MGALAAFLAPLDGVLAIVDCGLDCVSGQIRIVNVAGYPSLSTECENEVVWPLRSAPIFPPQEPALFPDRARQATPYT